MDNANFLCALSCLFSLWYGYVCSVDTPNFCMDTAKDKTYSQMTVSKSSDHKTCRSTDLYNCQNSKFFLNYIPLGKGWSFSRPLDVIYARLFWVLH